RSPSMIELAGTLDSSSGAVAVSPPTEKRTRVRWPLFAVAAAAVAAAAIITVVMLRERDFDHQAAAAAATASPSATAPAPSVATTVRAVEPAPSPAPPAPVALGRLQVKSVPSPAEVYIAGKLQGETPLELSLPPGHVSVS